jgi:hypothetical protein
LTTAPHWPVSFDWVTLAGQVSVQAAATQSLVATQVLPLETTVAVIVSEPPANALPVSV